MSVANTLKTQTPVLAPAITNQYANSSSGPVPGLYLPLAGGTMNPFPAGVINAHTIVGPTGGQFDLLAGAGGDVNVEATNGNASLTGQTANVSGANGVDINSTAGGNVGIDTAGQVIIGSVLTPTGMSVNTRNQIDIHNRCLITPNSAAITYSNNDYGLRVANYTNDAGNIQTGLLVDAIRNTIADATGAKVYGITSANNTKGVHITSISTQTGNVVGCAIEAIDSTTGFQATGINVNEVISGTNSSAIGIDIQQVRTAGGGGEIIGIRAEGIAANTGPCIGISLRNLGSETADCIGMRVKGAAGAGTGLAAGFVAASISADTGDAFAVNATDIGSANGSAFAFSAANIIGNTDSTGLSLNTIIGTTGPAFGISIGGVSSLGNDAYGLHIDDISSTGGGAFGVFQASSNPNVSNVFCNRIECGSVESSSSTNPSIHAFGTIAASVQSSATTSYTILNNGGNTIISLTGNTSMDMPSVRYTGAQYIIWKKHGGNVVINGNGANINGAASFSFGGTSYQKMTIVWDGTEWLAHQD